MKMNKTSRIWNLGDTSFRRKRLLDDYIALLRVLKEHSKKHDTWNEESQEQFHLKVLSSTDLLKETKVTKELDRRARTMTNALAKVGLCDRDRRITDVGNILLEIDNNDINYNLDKFEKKLSISDKNILFLRQLIKFSIFSHNEQEHFNPFLIMIGFLIEYDFLEDDHFKYIVQNLYFGQDYESMILEYKNVKNGNMSFEEYLNTYILFVDSDIDDDKINKFKNTGEGFKEVFKNRKTSESVEDYFEFYNYLIEFRKENTNGKVSEEVSKGLLDISRKDSMKKAFMTNKIFNLPNRSAKDYRYFINDNQGHILFNSGEKEFRKELYNIFNIAKNEDLVREYYDITVRTFNLTGIIDFKNGRVRISKKYFKDILSEFKEELVNLICRDRYKDMNEYRVDLDKHDISTIEILDIDIKEVIQKDIDIAQSYNIDDIEKLESYYRNIDEQKFIEFINIEFPKDKIISILNNIKNREDEKVFEIVTDNANIPTIFEYIIAISWYRISEIDSPYKLLDSMNLSLDGSYLPLSHAVGGDGDIVIDYEDHILMLEVTLMDLNNQRRNELEPVIRHTTNLTIENSERPVYTIFVANDIDYNTSKIFRACSYVNLESSRSNGKTKNGINIFSMKIDEIIECLEKNINYKEINKIIYDEYKRDTQYLLEYDWREKVIYGILN